MRANGKGEGDKLDEYNSIIFLPTRRRRGVSDDIVESHL